MNVIAEMIKNQSSPEDIPILLWLNENYSIHYKWMVVARIVHHSNKTSSYRPTIEGIILYRNREEVENEMQTL